eukprot:5094771-Prymnesium_polylepis.1
MDGAAPQVARLQQVRARLRQPVAPVEQHGILLVHDRRRRVQRGLQRAVERHEERREGAAHPAGLIDVDLVHPRARQLGRSIEAGHGFFCTGCPSARGNQHTGDVPS